MTTTMRIECAPNTRDSLRTVHQLIDEASRWLRTKDTKQWATPWPTRKKRDERVRDDIRDRKTWIVWDAGIPAATVTIAEEANPHVWRGFDVSGPAVYVHRLITARGYAGLGLGAFLIDWAGLRGLYRNEARWIRIDVWTDNDALHQYYKMARFEFVGNCADRSYPSGALFQKPTADINETECPIPRFSGLSADFDLPCRVPAIR